MVATGRLTDPAAQAFLEEIVLRRRDRVIRHWLTRTNPVDDFSIRRTDAGPVVEFANVAEEAGVVPAASTYGMRWYRFDNRTGDLDPVAGSRRTASDERIGVPDGAWGNEDRFGLRYAAATLETHHPDFPRWRDPVEIVVRRDRRGDVEVVGVRRPLVGLEVPA